MNVLGVDLGTSYCGFTLISKNGNNPQVLYAEQLWLRSDKNFSITEKMKFRRDMRRGRRYRKRYRKPRFDNRPKIKCKVCGGNTPSSKYRGRQILCRKCQTLGHHTFTSFKHQIAWLSPTLKNKAESVIKTAEKIKKLFPIDEVRVEVADFDFQKIKDPEIKGEDYQKGYNLDFRNRRMYVIERDKRICQVCKGKNCKNRHLTVHHILAKAEGGTDQPENLICVSRECHQKIHQDLKLYEKIKEKFQDKFKDLKFASQVSSYKSVVLGYLRENFPKVRVTYGYITEAKREEMGLDKNHINDAIAIASDFGEKPKLPETIVLSRCIPKGTYQIYRANPEKGHIFKKHQANRYLVNKRGIKFQRYDKVRGKVAGRAVEGFIGALFSKGAVKIVDINAKVLEPYVSINNLELLEKRKTIISILRASRYIKNSFGNNELKETANQGE